MEPRKKSIFPHKLWQMVNNRQLDPAIRWTDDGQAFQLSEGELKNLCLGKENQMFYTRNPKSFVRQLHLYGFRKIGKNRFTHQSFQRDKPFLIDNIKRSYRDKPASSARGANHSANNSNNNNLTTANNNNNSSQRQQHIEIDFRPLAKPETEASDADNSIVTLESLVACEPIKEHDARMDTCEYQFFAEGDNIFDLDQFLYI